MKDDQQLLFEEWYARYPNSNQCRNIAEAAWNHCCSYYQKQITMLQKEIDDLHQTLDQWPAEQTVIEFEGKHYHFRDGKVLTYEDGKAIPAHVCLCYAKSDSECCCGAWRREIED